MKIPLPATDFSAGRSLQTLTKSNFRTLGLTTLGGALEFYGVFGGMVILSTVTAVAQWDSWCTDCHPTTALSAEPVPP